MEHNTNGKAWDTNEASKCPFIHGGDSKFVAGQGTSNLDWWPNMLKTNMLRQNSA